MGIVVQKTTITERVADLQYTSNIDGQKNMEKPKTYIYVSLKKALFNCHFKYFFFASDYYVLQFAIRSKLKVNGSFH